MADIQRNKFCLLCVLFLVSSFVITGGENLPPITEKNCTYAITIETSCTKGADTSGHISLRFGDKTSNDILVRHLNTKHVTQIDPLFPNNNNNKNNLDDTSPVPFRACTVDQFHVSNKCMRSPVCYLYLKLSGNDDWRPGFAQVRIVDAPHLDSDLFYFRRYLPRGVWHGSDTCDTEVTPFGIKYKRKVFMKKRKSGRNALFP